MRRRVSTLGPLGQQCVSPGKRGDENCRRGEKEKYIAVNHRAAPSTAAQRGTERANGSGNLDNGADQEPEQ